MSKESSTIINSIILVLIENPLANAVEICEKVNSLISDRSVSVSTIKRYVNRLFDIIDTERKDVDPNIRKNRDVILNKKYPLDKSLRGATTQLSYDLLDLELHSFIVCPHKTNWEKNTKIIRRFCIEHPYTSYRNLVFGKQNAVFIQFTIPRKGDTLTYLKQSFDELILLKIVDSYTHYNLIARPTGMKGKIKLEKWDHDNQKWNVNFKEIDRVLTEDIEDNLNLDFRDSHSKVSNMTLLDNIIIREFSKNARRLQKQIIEDILENPYYETKLDEINITKFTVSRKISEFKQSGIFNHYNLIYSRTKFGMFNQVLYIFDKTDRRVENLIKCIKKQFLPFPCAFLISEDAYLLWINLPPIEMTQFTELLTLKFPNTQTYLMSRNQQRFYFWFDNYDYSNKYWKNSKEYICDLPINQIKNLVK